MTENQNDREQLQGWISPVYRESRNMDINLDILKRNRCIGINNESPGTDSYKILKTQAQQRLQEKNQNTIMITSARSGEGKTLTAINLSLVLAREFSNTVMLIDCDFRKQQVHKYLGIESTRGMSDYLLDDISLKELIIWPGIEKFTLISGGDTTLNSAELLNSPRMKSIVPEIKNRYRDRYVIFDVPAVLEGADALAFAPLVESIIVVVESGRTSRKDIRRVMELMPKEKLLGFVINRQGVNQTSSA